MPPPIKVFVLNDKQRELIEDNMLLFHKCFHKLKGNYSFLNDDDIWDCCTEAAVKVAYSLDEKKGKYSTLLYIAAEKNAMKRVRYYDVGCRKGSKFNVSLDYELGENGEDTETFADRYLGVNDKYDFIETDAIEKAFNVLKDREREIMHKIVFDDIARVEIAKEWGVRPQAVNRYVASAKEKLRKVYKL